MCDYVILKKYKTELLINLDNQIRSIFLIFFTQSGISQPIFREAEDNFDLECVASTNIQRLFRGYVVRKRISIMM